MAILVESGRAAVAAAIKNQDIFLGWGSGLPGWDANPPAEDIKKVSLENPLGYRELTAAQFVVDSKASNPSIVVPQGQFDPSPNQVPTKYLYLKFAFGQNDAAQGTIRELGIFVGTKVSGPGTQGYYLPSEVSSVGTLLVLEYIDQLVRSSSIRQQFEFVIQF